MTATEPQTAAPESRRWRYRRNWGWMESVLALALFWLVWPVGVRDGLPVWGVFLIPLLVRRANACSRRRVTPWYFDGIAAVFFFGDGAILHHLGSLVARIDSVFAFGAAAMLCGTMVWRFFRAWQQYTLRTLMLVTLGVAMLCSASHYWGIMLLLGVLMAFSIAAMYGVIFGSSWLAESDNVLPKARPPSDAERRRVIDMVERTTPSPPLHSRSEDGPENLQSEI